MLNFTNKKNNEIISLHFKLLLVIMTVNFKIFQDKQF